MDACCICEVFVGSLIIGRPTRRRGPSNVSFFNIKLCFMDVNHNCGECAGFFRELLG